MSRSQLNQLQGVVNYLRLGRWMREHGFHFDQLVRDRWAMFDLVASRVEDKRVLYMEFGVLPWAYHPLLGHQASEPGCPVAWVR